MKTAKLEGSGMKLSTFVNIALSRATYLRPASSYLSLQSNKHLDRSSLESQPMELIKESLRTHGQAIWLDRGKIRGFFLRPVHIQTFATGDDTFACCILKIKKLQRSLKTRQIWMKTNFQNKQRRKNKLHERCETLTIKTSVLLPLAFQSDTMYLLINFREKTSTKLSTSYLLLLIKILCWRFCGGVEYLKQFDHYSLWDKGVRPWRWRRRCSSLLRSPVKSVCVLCFVMFLCVCVLCSVSRLEGLWLTVYGP